MDISTLILPENFLSHFDLLNVEELCCLETKTTYYNLYLEERNLLPPNYSIADYESKGFYEEKTIQDFPLRGKAVYLKIKRRRWRLKKDKSTVVKSDYTFIAEGAKLTRELSDFLKATGRYTS